MANDITTNVLQFTADLKQWAEQLQVDILTAEKAVVHSLVQKLGERTPKDSERATANWNTSIGQPDHTLLPEGKYPDSPRRIAQQAQAVTNGMTKPEVVWVSNPVPYIHKLNSDGSSKQAPAFFVETAIAETEAEFS